MAQSPPPLARSDQAFGLIQILIRSQGHKVRSVVVGLRLPPFLLPHDPAATGEAAVQHVIVRPAGRWGTRRAPRIDVGRVRAWCPAHANPSVEASYLTSVSLWRRGHVWPTSMTHLPRPGPARLPVLARTPGASQVDSGNARGHGSRGARRRHRGWSRTACARPARLGLNAPAAAAGALVPQGSGSSRSEQGPRGYTPARHAWGV